MRRRETNLVGAGEREIDWIQTKQRKLCDFFESIHSLTGAWQNERARLWCRFWSILHIAWIIVYLYSIPFLIGKLDLFAHLIHHMVVAVGDFTYIDLLSNKKQFVKAIYDGVRRTYCYNSETVRNYHKNLMSDRLKTHDRNMAIVIAGGGISLFMVLQVFFILEATLLKNYETMYPIHLPFDIHHPATYTTIIGLQNLTIYFTMFMIMGSSAAIYTSYAHLMLEYDVLMYVVLHVDDLATEKSSGDDGKVRNTKNQETLADAFRFYCYHIAKHHACIRRYFANVKNAFKVFILFVIITGAICSACVGIALLSDNLGVKLKFVMILFVQTLFIYGWCWIGEEITRKETALGNVLAYFPWWKMPKECHSTVVLLLMRCQMPMVLTTPFNQIANRGGFKDLASASYSYFGLLYQTKFAN